MATRTIESPGVEFNEKDASLRTNFPIGTKVLALGFAKQGPTNEILEITSKSEFKNIYGNPTNAAERYFYNTCDGILNSNAKLMTTRLPYGSGAGLGYDGGYSALCYPVVSRVASSGATVAYASGNYFEIGEPSLIKMDDDTYEAFVAGQVDWATVGGGETSTDPFSHGIVIVNKGRTTVNNYSEGYYVTLTDNRNLEASGAVVGVDTIYTTDMTLSALNSNTLGFNLTSDDTGISLSQDIVGTSTFMKSESSYDNSLIVTVVKINKNVSDSGVIELNYGYTETHIGSLNPRDIRVDAVSKELETFCIENKTANNSNLIDIFINPNIKKASWGETAKLTTSDRRINAMGTFATNRDEDTKNIGTLTSKITNALYLVENKDLVDLDIVVEGGLGTIFAYSNLNTPTRTFNDEQQVNTQIDALRDQATGNSSAISLAYNSIFNLFKTFASITRKDCLFIADPLRGIFVQGRDYKVSKGKRPTDTFSKNYYWALKNLYGAGNSSYVCTYGNWVKVYDDSFNDYIWMPFSGNMAGIMARMDSASYPWDAPAGLNRGLIGGVVDIAVNPKQKERDLLYTIGVNPIVYTAGDGYYVLGQKTLQAKPSAFDRLNVRRLFLYAEKAVYKLARYFVMKPNTAFTRTQFINVLTPLFDVLKQYQGVYDYKLVCDDKLNDATTIDNNELKMNVLIKPTRTAEFILIEFVATRTDANFDELISQGV